MLTFILFIIAINRIKGHSIAAHFDIDNKNQAQHLIPVISATWETDVRQESCLKFEASLVGIHS